MRICIVQPKLDVVSETFLRGQADGLDASIIHFGQSGLPAINGTPILSQQPSRIVLRSLQRKLIRRPWSWEITQAFIEGFRQIRAEVVLAQYGPTAVEVMDACRLSNIPLVAHFHGFDASRLPVLNQLKDHYNTLFAQAKAIISVSKPMSAKLISLGARPERVHLNHYGVDVDKFCPSPVSSSKPVFLAVGRLVEKKSPHLTLLAFSKVISAHPDARLRIVGDGPLRQVCDDLVHAMKLQRFVTLCGASSHEQVAKEMQAARAFVQHSVEALDGDSEGLPNSILEASASGLPVIATKHAGIPESVVHSKTGFLVEERDVDGMADAMIELANNPSKAALMGSAGRDYMCESFQQRDSISRLRNILAKSIL